MKAPKNNDHERTRKSLPKPPCILLPPKPKNLELKSQKSAYSPTKFQESPLDKAVSLANTYSVKTATARPIQEKLKELKQKNLQAIKEKVQYKAQIQAAGGTSFMPVGVLRQSYQFLAKYVRQSPRDSIKMNIPETLILSFERTVTYLYTNSRGYLEIEVFNEDNDSDDSKDHGHPPCKDGHDPPEANVARSDSLSFKSVERICEIVNHFHDCHYKNQGLQERDAKEKVMLFPIAVCKYTGEEDGENQTELHYFAYSIVNTIVRQHGKDSFIVQRFVRSRGLCPSIIRCEVVVNRYPDIDFKKLNQELLNGMTLKDRQQPCDHSNARLQASQGQDHESPLESDGDLTLSQGSGSPNPKDQGEKKPQSNIRRSTHASHHNVKTFHASYRNLDYQNSIVNRLTQVDKPEIQLKVYKISSHTYYDGKQQTERIQTVIKNPAALKQADDAATGKMKNLEEKKEPAFITIAGPIIRLDQEFMQHVLKNNSQYKKAHERKHWKNVKQRPLGLPTSQGFRGIAQQKVASQAATGKFDKLLRAQLKVEQDHNHYKGRTTCCDASAPKPLSEDPYFSIFFHKAKDHIHSLNDIFNDKRFMLQFSIQKDINEHAQALDKQFVINESRFGSESNVIETNPKGGYRADASVLNIQDQDSLALRTALDQILRLLQRSQPFVQKVVADFVNEQGTNNILFLQLKYVDVDSEYITADKNRKKPPPSKNFKAEDRIVDPNASVEQDDNTNCFDFILNSAPNNSSYLALKKEYNEKNINLLDQGAYVRHLHSKNAKKQHVMLECAGDYCDINDVNLQENLPDYHQMVLIKMRNEKEKGTVADITTKSFADADDLLPKSNHLVYQLPQMIILLDQDIKNIWKEQIIIKNRLAKLRNLNNEVIEGIYSEYNESGAGQKYQCASVESRYQIKKLCHQCYEFYMKLSKKLVDHDGSINLQTLHQLSDPQFFLDKENKEKFNFIKNQLYSNLKQKISQMFSSQMARIEVHDVGKEPQTKSCASKGEAGEQPQPPFNMLGSLAKIAEARKLTQQKEVKTKRTEEADNESSTATVSVKGKKERPPVNMLDVIFKTENQRDKPIQPTMPSIYEREKNKMIQRSKIIPTGRPPRANLKNSSSVKLKKSTLHTQLKPNEQPYKRLDFKNLTPVRQSSQLRGCQPFFLNRRGLNQSQYNSQKLPRQDILETESNTELPKIKDAQEAPEEDAATSTHSGKQRLYSDYAPTPGFSKAPSEKTSQNPQVQVSVIDVDSQLIPASPSPNQSPARVGGRNDHSLVYSYNNTPIGTVLEVASGRSQHQNEFEIPKQMGSNITQYYAQAKDSPRLSQPSNESDDRYLNSNRQTFGHEIYVDEECQGGDILQNEALKIDFENELLPYVINNFSEDKILQIMRQYRSGMSIDQIQESQTQLDYNQQKILELRLQQLQRKYLQTERNADDNPSQPLEVYHAKANIKNSLKQQQFEQKTFINQFFKKVNKSILMDIISKNTINFDVNRVIAQTTYQSATTTPQKKFKIRKINLKKKAHRNDDLIIVENQQPHNNHINLPTYQNRNPPLPVISSTARNVNRYGQPLNLGSHDKIKIVPSIPNFSDVERSESTHGRPSIASPTVATRPDSYRQYQSAEHSLQQSQRTKQMSQNRRVIHKPNIRRQDSHEQESFRVAAQDHIIYRELEQGPEQAKSKRGILPKQIIQHDQVQEQDDSSSEEDQDRWRREDLYAPEADKQQSSTPPGSSQGEQIVPSLSLEKVQQHQNAEQLQDGGTDHEQQNPIINADLKADHRTKRTEELEDSQGHPTLRSQELSGTRRSEVRVPRNISGSLRYL